MRSNKKLHEALILFTILSSLEEDKLGKEYDKAKRIVSGIKTWKLFRRFSKEEYNLMVEIGKDPEIVKLKDTRISYLIYSLELAKLWALTSEKGDSIGVSKKKLVIGGKAFYVDMVKLKYSDEKEYLEKTDIIDESIRIADSYFNRTKEVLWTLRNS